MARKRLLTILGGAVAVVGLQVAPATALDLEADLGSAKVGASLSEDGLEAELGSDEDAEIEAKVSKDGLDAKVGDAEVSTEDLTEKAAEEVEETTEETTGGERDADDERDSGSDAGSDSGEGDGDAGDPGSDGGQSTGDDAQQGGSSDGSAGDREVTTAGDDAESVEREGRSEAPERPDIEQAQGLQLSGDRGREDAGGDEVTPAFELSGARDEDTDLDEPMIAAPPESADDPDWEPIDPQNERSDAELAAIPATPGSGEGNVPAGLKLVAGLLVAGTATVWHVARRELAVPGSLRTGS